MVERGEEIPIRAIALDVCSGLAAAAGDPARSARTFAAATAAWDRVGASREPLDERHYARILSSVRETLGSDAFEAAFEVGRSLPMESAIAEALQWLKAGGGGGIR